MWNWLKFHFTNVYTRNFKNYLASWAIKRAIVVEEMLIGFCANNFGTVMAILDANILISSLSDFSNEYGMRFYQISKEKDLRKILDYFFDSNFYKFVYNSWTFYSFPDFTTFKTTIIVEKRHIQKLKRSSVRLITLWNDFIIHFNFATRARDELGLGDEVI